MLEIHKRGPSHRSARGLTTLVQPDQCARKIPILPGEDILRWGHSSRGTFNIQEAYAIKENFNLLPPGKVWNKIWSLKHWPKISIFLWLVVHGSILTWDNLMKRGFTGPSICMLCMKEVESINHLLNIFPFNTQVWDQCPANEGIQPTTKPTVTSSSFSHSLLSQNTIFTINHSRNTFPS
jgi:hypothetical protein